MPYRFLIPPHPNHPDARGTVQLMLDNIPVQLSNLHCYNNKGLVHKCQYRVNNNTGKINNVNHLLDRREKKHQPSIPFPQPSLHRIFLPK